MGQKCSCFDKEMDSKTEKNMKDNTFSPVHRKESMSLESKLKRAKQGHQMNSEGTSIGDAIDMGVNDKEKTYNEKIKIIINNISCWFYKKKFLEKQKTSLSENSENIFNQLFTSENIANLKEISGKIKNNFEINGWKKHYKEFPLKLQDFPESRFQGDFSYKNNFNDKIDINDDSNYLEEIFRKSFKTNIIYLNPQNQYVEKQSFIYKGQINKYGERHGEGVLYHVDGSSMEIGTWYNDHSIGWCRTVLPNGIYFESKDKIKLN